MRFTKFEKNELERLVEEITNKKINSCKKCGGTMKLLARNKAICTSFLCKTKINNIWEGSIFKNAKTTKVLVLQILELWMQKLNTKMISYVTGASRTSIWRILNKVNKLLVPKYYDSLEKIGGKSMIVEIDESKFGKRKYNRGHKVDGVWVLGMVEKEEPKRIILFRLDNRKKETLTNFIEKNIVKDTNIRTDCWKGYVDLKNLFNSHQTVNHSVCFKDSVTGVHTNTIEGSWFGVKHFIPTRNRTKEKIELYLCRYMICKNSKKHPLLELIKYLV